jgi:hypothetical protein
MSLKTRVARLEAQAGREPHEYVLWVYYTEDEGTSVDFVSDDCVRLFVGRDAPHPFPGVHIYGMERGLPYPRPRPDRTKDEQPRLSAEIVGKILDTLEGTLEPRLAAIVQRARSVLIIDNDKPPSPPVVPEFQTGPEGV